MRYFSARLAAAAMLGCFSIITVFAAEETNPQSSQSQSRNQQVTSFYQGDDGGYILVINNDLNPASINVNTEQKMILMQPGDIKDAYSIPSGGAFPMYIPIGDYQVGWGGPGNAAAMVNAGQTTTVAFEPYGMDNTGMRVLVNDGSNNTSTVLYNSDQERLASLESQTQSYDGQQESTYSVDQQVAVDSAQTTPVVVVEDNSPVVVYESSPVVAVESTYVPDPPEVTFAAGFFTGAAIWGTYHYWNDDWYDHWDDWDDWNGWDDWNEHADARIQNRDDRMHDRIDNRDDRNHDRIDNRNERIHDRIDNRDNRMDGRIVNRGDMIDNQGQRLDAIRDRIGNQGANLGGRTMPPRPMPFNQFQGGQRVLPPAPSVDSRLGGQFGNAGTIGQRGFQRGNFAGGGNPGFARGGAQRGNFGGEFHPQTNRSFERGGGFTRSGGGASFRMPERHSVTTPRISGGRSFGGGRAVGGGRRFGGGGEFRRR